LAIGRTAWSKKGIEHCPIERRFDEPVLTLTDPDGMRLTLVAISGAKNEPAWSIGKVTAENARFPRDDADARRGRADCGAHPMHRLP
jgi:hypothetical protein